MMNLTETPKKIISGMVMVLVDSSAYLRVGNLILPSEDGGTKFADAMSQKISDQDLTSQGKFRIPVHGVAQNSSNAIIDGDVVFFSQTDSVNCEKVNTPSGECYFIPAENIFLSLRNGEVVMQNGFLLGKTKEIEVFNVMQKVMDRVIITHAGTPSVDPRFNSLDAKDVLVGDEVIYAIASERLLEQPHMNMIGLKDARVIKRRHVKAIIRDDKI